MRRVPRFTVRVRLLAIFLLIGVVPLAVLGMVAYTRAVALVGADPATAAYIVDGLQLTILFLLGVGVAAAVGLSVLAAHSVAAPLKDVEAAMAEVERGRLDGRAPVVSTDEIGAVAEGFNRMLHGLRERERVKETFGKYVTPEIRDEILAGRIRGEGELVEATLLFADLRDFTPWVEATEPRQVVRDLNAYFTEMEARRSAPTAASCSSSSATRSRPCSVPPSGVGHAAHAVRTAVEMRQRLAAWNDASEADRPGAAAPRDRHSQRPRLAGNIGSAERLAYALVGDAVNLASRIQGLTKDVDSTCWSAPRPATGSTATIALEELPPVQVKGREEEVTLYRVA